jgi:hypothetical protein
LDEKVTSNKKQKDDFNPAQMFAMMQELLRHSEINTNANTRDNVQQNESENAPEIACSNESANQYQMENFIQEE